MTVERVRVGEVLALQRVPVQPDPGTEYVRIGIRSFGKGILHYEPKPGDQLGSLRFFDVQPDRLIVSNIKGWEGAIAVSSESDAGCIASNRFLSYRPIGRRVDVRWARWYFLSEPGIELVQRASPGSADRNRTLAIDRFEALTIPLPPIDEQRRVARKLDQIRARCDQLAQCQQHGEELWRLLVESRVDRLFSDIVAPELPIDALGDVRGGIQKSSIRAPGANPVRYLTVAHVGRDEISMDYPRYFEVTPAELGRRRLQPGDVLIIEGNGSVSQIGRAALFTGTVEPCVHQNHVIRVRPSTDLIEPDFLNLFLNSPTGRRAVQAQARTSSGLQSLSVGRIRQILVPVPGLDEQRKVATETRLLQRQDARVAEFACRATNIANAVMPAALNDAFAGLLGWPQLTARHPSPATTT